jgi:iron complex outermembrane receptor protein
VSLTDTIIVASHWTYHFDNFDLKFITGGTKYDYNLTGDQDGTGVSSYTTCYTNTAANIPGCLATGAGAQTYQTKYAFHYREAEEWWSNEINMISTGDGPLQYVFGAFLYHEDYVQPVFTMLENETRLDGFILNSATGGAAPPDPLRRIYDDRPHFNLHSKALFTQIDYKFSDH